jgi:hypothetical protein
MPIMDRFIGKAGATTKEPVKFLFYLFLPSSRHRDITLPLPPSLSLYIYIYREREREREREKERDKSRARNVYTRTHAHTHTRTRTHIYISRSILMSEHTPRSILYELQELVNFFCTVEKNARTGFFEQVLTCKTSYTLKCKDLPISYYIFLIIY